jgi:hypothetical protein
MPVKIDRSDAHNLARASQNLSFILFQQLPDQRGFDPSSFPSASSKEFFIMYQMLNPSLHLSVTT